MASPTIPGYERLTQIGKGGFSRVYRGEQAKLKRGVAIKVLNFGLNDEADRRSFERECELMGRVSTHPNIVTVHDTAFTEDGQPCIVMEHYPGGSLADLISEVRRLNIKEVLEVGVSIAAALEASHQAGVLHCDLKPQNILISEFGQPALGDFGISTFSEERTRTGGDAGAGFTLAYASPEIVEGASPSVESDVYSLAATLYTSLAGRRPFYYLGPDGSKPTAADQARRILLEEPSSLADTGVPVEVDQVIRQAMAKDPSQRPSSAADFAQALYQVGQKLGLGISAPRIADHGALPVLDPRVDFTEPSLPATATAAAPPAESEVPPASHSEAPLAALVEDATEARSAAMAAIAQGLPSGNDATELRVEPSSPEPRAPEPRAPEPRAPEPRAPEPAAEVSETTALRSDPPGSSTATPYAAKRRQLAPLIGLASLLIVGAVIFAVTRSGTAERTIPATPVPTTTQRSADLVLAPPPPTDVAAFRVGADQVMVTWSNAPVDGVVYEVRRDGIPDGDDTAQSPFMSDTLDADRATCFEVLAARGNRLSPSVNQVCVPARGPAYVEVAPSVCEGTCTVSAILTGFEADQAMTVTAIDAANNEPVAIEFAAELRTNDDGQAPDWVLPLDETVLPGTYLLEFVPDAGSDSYRAAVVVLAIEG